MRVRATSARTNVSQLILNKFTAERNTVLLSPQGLEDAKNHEEFLISARIVSRLQRVFGQMTNER
jgi:hypothetical protein